MADVKYIGGIRYKLEEDGDLKGLINLLMGSKFPSNKFQYIKSLNEISKIFVKEALSNEVKVGQLKPFVNFLAKEKKIPINKAIEEVLSQKIDEKLANKWLKTT